MDIKNIISTIMGHIPDCEHAAVLAELGLSEAELDSTGLAEFRMKVDQRNKLLDELLPKALCETADSRYALPIKDQDGCYDLHLYAQYDDWFMPSTVEDILQAEDPECAFYEKLDEYFSDSRSELEEEMVDETIHWLIRDRRIGTLSQDERNVIWDYVLEHILIHLPDKHFLGQKVNLNIFIDTGDSNYDFTLNSIYPAYCGDADEEPNDKASIVWLAQTQGYSKAQLWEALRQGDIADPHGFLGSVRQELANVASHMNVLTFLVRMSLGDAIELNRQILQNTNTSVTISRDAVCGLYDPFSGAGSVLEIKPEKDVKLPIQCIRSALPDGTDGADSISSVYGMCGTAWGEDLIKLEEVSTLAILRDSGLAKK